ncbi:MAG TPA: LacI family DNA-binding transcriptional regulator [Anaerolineae bacterium]|nr:LacI family DNA-binding transcriptional regulator [Anaerolineae bacterium]
MPELKTLPRITIAHVAERAGVSIATVSRVINGTGPVTEETAAQVRTAITELKYVPYAAARSLASKKTNMLGLLLPEVGSDFMSPLLHGIEIAARENDFGLLISTESRSSTPFHRPLGEHNTDGLLIFTNSLNEAELTHLYERRFPLVLLHQSPPTGLNIPCITFENKSGARKLVDHLIETHSYRGIAFLRGPEDNEDSSWRELGYREALEAHHLPFDPALVATGGFSAAGARAPVMSWLNDGVAIEAIFAGDDATASGVISVLREAGKRVPEDIAVVGFDDLPTSRYLTPPLTTIHAPIEQAGYEAARQLGQLIRYRQAESLVLLPTELVIRRSCGCTG